MKKIEYLTLMDCQNSFLTARVHVYMPAMLDRLESKIVEKFMYRIFMLCLSYRNLKS